MSCNHMRVTGSAVLQVLGDRARDLPGQWVLEQDSVAPASQSRRRDAAYPPGRPGRRCHRAIERLSRP